MDQWYQLSDLSKEWQILHIVGIGLVLGLILSKVALWIVRFSLKHEDKLILRSISSRLGKGLHSF